MNYENMPILIPCTLKDTSGESTLERKAVVHIRPTGIAISVEGYNDTHTEDGELGEPIFVELFNGKLLVHCWSDINKEEPTHSIDMEGARETLREQKVGYLS